MGLGLQAVAKRGGGRRDASAVADAARLRAGGTPRGQTGPGPAASASGGNAPERLAGGDLWAAPRGGDGVPVASKDLAVHPRKVSDLAGVLRRMAEVAEARRRRGGASAGGDGPALITAVTGPPGCGKATCVRVVAAEMGFQVSAWPPRSAGGNLEWAEHLHLARGDVLAGDGRPRYRTAVDEFQEFMEGSRYPALAAGLGASVSGRFGTLVVVEDFPEAFGREARRRVVEVAVAGMRGLERAGIPCVVILTDAAHDASRASASERDGVQAVVWPALQVALESEGARFAHVAFNPLTPTMVRKALELCASRRGFPVGGPGLSADAVQAIADGCGGDLRQAIHTLQFTCMGGGDLEEQRNATAAAAGGKKSKRSRPNAPRGQAGSGAADEKREAPAPNGWASRDAFLTLIHATGKVLYNKREPGASVREPNSNPNARLPLEAKAMAPEDVVRMVGVDCGRLLAFVHENMHEFFDDIIDASFALRCLSDADMTSTTARLASFGSGGSSGRAAQDGDQLAALVGMRGVMFSNTHPTKGRFLQIRGPQLTGVDEQSRSAERQLGAVEQALRADVQMGTLGQGRTSLCTLTFPFVRAMARGSAAAAVRRIGERGGALAHRLTLGDFVLQPPDFRSANPSTFRGLRTQQDLFPASVVELAELAADQVGRGTLPSDPRAGHFLADAFDTIEEVVSD